MTERVRFKSREGRGQEWDVIGGTARSLDLQSRESGRILYSINRDRIETVPTNEQEPTP